MRDKPTPGSDDVFAIPDLPVLVLEGRDALAFAQAQFMNDATALAVGRWQWSGWLTPKGRLIALFALLRLEEQTLWLLPQTAGDIATLATRLQRFVFRSKLTLRIRDDLRAQGRFSPPAVASGGAIAGTAGDGIELDFGGDGGPRALVLSAGPAAAADPASLQRWHGLDLAHGLPRLPESQLEQWTPQQLSLERLNAFSVHKGCYPGQEIVARTHFLGQSKRGLARFEGAGAAHAGEIVPASPAAGQAGEPRAIGQLVCAAGTQCLGVVALDAGDGPFQQAGLPLARLPLFGGLER